MDSLTVTIVILIAIAVIVVGILVRISVVNGKKEKERQAREQAIENERQAKILAHKGEWQDDVIALLIAKRVRPGMLSDMCLLAWGKPNDIQNKELTKKGQKTRWVYGQPRQGARYLYFTNDELTKIEN